MKGLRYPPAEMVVELDLQASANVQSVLSIEDCRK